MMKTKLCLLAAVVACVSNGHAQNARLTLRVANPLAMARADETVALPWLQLTHDLPAVTPARVRVIELGSGREITSQALDADGDGRPDSLLFQVSLGALDARQYAIEANAPAQKVVSRVHSKFVPEREDVAWESDRIAFRIYGKKLWQLENLHTNGIDVWVKRTRNLVLDAWYGKGHDSYHVDTGEGADYFQVGPTLGAGGTGLWVNGRLYRGDNFLEHRIIADGPIRTIFELDYGAIDAAGTKATEHKRVSIDAGQNYFRQESTFRAAGGSLDVVVGLVKRPDLVGSTSKDRDWVWLSAWGPIEMRTHGHGDLGTAVLVPKHTLVDFEEIADHYLSISRIPAGGTLVSYVGAGWTASRDFSGAEDWWRSVDEFAQRLATPVTLTSVKSDGRAAQ